MPFFACMNIFFDNKIQKDIQRYIYCEKFGIPPYKGSYGEQPSKWVEKGFLIKSIIERKKTKAMNYGK